MLRLLELRFTRVLKRKHPFQRYANKLREDKNYANVVCTYTLRAQKARQRNELWSRGNEHCCVRARGHRTVEYFMVSVSSMRGARSEGYWVLSESGQTRAVRVCTLKHLTPTLFCMVGENFWSALCYVKGHLFRYSLIKLIVAEGRE